MSYTASAIGEPEEMPLKELVLLSLGKSLFIFLIDITQIFELVFGKLNTDCPRVETWIVFNHPDGWIVVLTLEFHRDTARFAL
jgi:hypothetical protein